MKHLAALAAALLAALIVASPGTAQAQTTHTETTDAKIRHAQIRQAQTTQVPASVRVLAVAPVLVQRTASLTVTAQVQNTGTSPLDDVSVRLRVLTDRLGGRDQVTRWYEGGDTREGVPVGAPADLPVPLAAGAGQVVTLQVPGTQLGLAGREFGAYGVAVEVRAIVDGVRERVAFARTTMQWQPPAKEYRAQGIAWLVPFTGLPGASSPDAPTLAEVAAAVGAGSRLRHLLDAASAPGVAWAVDPALLTTLQRAATGPNGTTTPAATPTASSSAASTAPTTTPPASPTSSPTSSSATTDAQARQVVRTYLAELRAAASGREVLELAYADPDVDALAGADATELLAAARAVSAGIIDEVLGVTPRGDIAWPADGRAGNDALADWKGVGVRAVVLDAASRPLVDTVGYTVDARTQLPHAITGLLADPVLSGLLGRLAGAEATASTRFIAETAATTTERPGLARRMLVAASRDLDPDPAAFRALVAATAVAPWLHTVQVADLLGSPGRADAADLERRVAPAPADAGRGIGVRDVAVVQHLREDLSALAEVLENPSSVNAAVQRATLELLSSAWRGEHAALVARQRAVRDVVDARTEGVTVLPSTINFLRNEGRLQITVSNELDQPVHGVRVHVTAPNPKLLVERPTSDPLTLEPGQRGRVQVPVQALASGTVELQAQLVTPSGALLGPPEQVRVRVQPTGTWLLKAVGVVLGLAVLVGLVRSLRRGRRQVTATADAGRADESRAAGRTAVPGSAVAGTTGDKPAVDKPAVDKRGEHE